jgi:hypothetical protein
MIGWALTLLVPSVAWAVAHASAKRATARPSFAMCGAAGFLAPAALLRWCGRPFPEQLLGWVVSVLAWAGAFVIRDGQVFAAFGLIGAVWGLALGLKSLRTPAPPTFWEGQPNPLPPTTSERRGEPEEAGFSVELRCPTCGAALAVPVYHRMAKCGFCASVHVVAGRTGNPVVVVPDAVNDEASLKAAVAKHLGHRHYLKLYNQRVAPLISDAGFKEDETGHGLAVPDQGRTPAFVNAVEAEVARAAEAYAASIEPRLALRAWRRFLSPYWHRFGTVYQAAFGRDEAGLKRMEFAVATIEGSVAASSAPLPPMGKLSYLRTLRPLQGSPEAAIPALPVEVRAEELDRRFQQLERRSVELPVKAIAVHATLVPEVVALVYRPWHLAEFELDGERLELLVNGGAAAVEGEAPDFEFVPQPLGDLPGGTPVLAPSRCPECGADLPYAPDAEAHLCLNCYRLVAMRGSRWTTLPYLHEQPQARHWLVPFWRFPLRLRTATGELIVDLPHLTDGIDGTFDQIGDRPQVQEDLLVPGFRTRVSKAGVRLYRLLWPLTRGKARELSRERLSPALPPERVVDMTLSAEEARIFARVYLALAFSRRDLARAQVKTVRERFLLGRLEGEPEPAYLSLPQEVIGPFSNLFGRARVAALADLEGPPVRSEGESCR